MTKGRRPPLKDAAASSRQAVIQSNGHSVPASDAKAPSLGGLIEAPGLGGPVEEAVGPEQALEVMRLNEAHLRLVFDSAPIAISVARGRNVFYANPAYLVMFELSGLDELRHVDVLELFAPAWRAQLSENMQRRADGRPAPSSYEAEHVRKDGTRVSILLYVVRAVFPDGPATVAFLTDISERKRAEGELRASKSRGDVAEGVARSGSWRRDLLTNEESWSDGMFALFDVSPGELDGDATRIMEKRVHSADLGPVMRARAIAPETGEPVPLEFRVVHGDGGEHVIYSDGTVEFDEGGNPAAMTGYCKDVTELSEALGRLENAAIEWSETFDAMEDAVAVLDSDGRVVRCNAATLEVTGLHIDEIVGYRSCEIFHCSDGTGCLQRRAFEAAHPQTGILERDGRWLRMSCRPQRDAAGKVRGGVLVVTDISQLRRAEKAATEHAHFLEQLLKALPVPVYYLDATRHIVGYNEAYEAFTSRGCDLIGKTVFDVLPADVAERIDAVDRELLAHRGGVQEAESEMEGPGGTRRHTMSHKAVFSDVSGKPAGMVGVIMDMTAIRLAEEQLVLAAAQLKLTLEGAVAALGTTTELRDPYTAGHQRRVAQLAEAIALRLGWDEGCTELLTIAARLHDIGKIVVPAEILAKPGPLSQAEMQIIRQHPGAGADVVGTIGFDPDVAKMIRQHHERLDGSGYPDGLRGDETLAEARILAVADVVEAMISHRPYRPALPIEVAVAELEDGAGRRYEASAGEAAISLVRAEGFRLGPELSF